MIEKTDAWNEIVAAVKERPVSEVAKAFGVSPGELSAALIRNGVKRTAIRAKGSLPPNPVAAGVSKRTPQRKIVRKGRKSSTSTINGLTVRAGTSDALIAEWADILGVEPDNVIGERVGVSARAVGEFRRRNGIKGKPGRRPGSKNKKKAPLTRLPAEKGEAPAPTPLKLRARGKASKLDPYFHLIGKAPDADIASRAGVTPNAVAAFRRRRGIPSYREYLASSGGAPAPAAALAAAPARPAVASTAAVPVAPLAARPAKAAPAAGASVYLVQMADGSTAFVVANDLVGAAQQAQAHAGVTGVSLAGALL
ncbi:MAG: hypothetical protein AB8H79_16060 [Myxococcota bacterium]